MEGGPRVYRFFAEVPMYIRVCIYVYAVYIYQRTASRQRESKREQKRKAFAKRHCELSAFRMERGGRGGGAGRERMRLPPKDETSGYILTSGIDCGQEMVCVSA